MSFSFANRPSIMVPLNNQAYLNDELIPPPSYSSIFPTNDSNQTNNLYNNNNNTNLKIYSITTTPESIQIDTNNQTSNSNFISSNNNNSNTMSNSSNSNTLTGTNLEPISYDELFQINANNILTGRLNEPANFNPINTQSSTLLLAQNQISISTNLAKQIKQQFKKSYLLTHFLFIIIASLILITFQIILMSYNARLSYLATGIIGGLTNLATLIVSIATIKYAKLWLLLGAIVLHIICMLFSLGGMIIINCIAATKYYICSTSFQPKSIETLNERFVVCSQVGMKYINVSIILLGTMCVVLFLNFFFKLVNVFNYLHSVPSRHHQHLSNQLRQQQYHT